MFQALWLELHPMTGFNSNSAIFLSVLPRPDTKSSLQVVRLHYLPEQKQCGRLSVVERNNVLDRVDIFVIV